MKNDILLELHDVSVHFGGVTALNNVSLAIDEGEIVALMGPNGSGKTTALKVVFGLVQPSSGDVRWHGSPIVPVAHEMVERGVSYVPQGRQLFLSLTVRENLEMGGVTVKNKKELKRRIEETLELFPALNDKLEAPTRTLSGGQQQMVAFARGLMTDPKVLLLDEPSLGLAPNLVTEVFAQIRAINERHNTAIVVVEHNIRSLLGVVDRAYVLSKGKVSIDEPEARTLLSDNRLEKVFIGN